MTNVYLVRHAHAYWEPSEERPLSDRGRAGAEALAALLGPEGVTGIYSSPARRAVQTILPLAEAKGIRPELVPDLRERELAVPPSSPFEAAVEQAWRHPTVASPGSESNLVAAERGVRALRRILAAREGESVVLSTHGNLLALILNRFDPCYGLGTWRSLTFPDVYLLTFRGKGPPGIRRVWTEGPDGRARRPASVPGPPPWSRVSSRPGGRDG